MSVRLMGAVWSHPDITRSDYLLLLLAIADASNDEGMAWPSVTKLALKTRTSVSTVRRHLRDVEAAGWVATEVRIGSSNVYRLAVDKLLDLGQSDRTPPVNLTDPPGQSDTPVNLTPRSPVTDPPGHSYDRPPRSTVTDRTISEPSVNLLLPDSPVNLTDPPRGGGGRRPTTPQPDPWEALRADLVTAGLARRGWTADDDAAAAALVAQHGAPRLRAEALAGVPPQTLRGALARWRELATVAPIRREEKCPEHLIRYPEGGECAGCRGDRLAGLQAVRA